MISYEQEQAIRELVDRIKKAVDESDTFKGDVLLALNCGDVAVMMKEEGAKSLDDMMWLYTLMGSGVELVGILEDEDGSAPAAQETEEKR